MSPKQLLRRISDRAFGTALDRAVRRMGRDPRRSILFCWNRGLGDIALCLVPIFARIRRDVPQARIAVVTRPEIRWLLFGSSPEPSYASANVIDLRGRT